MSADDREKLADILRRIDELRAELVRVIGADAADAGDDEELRQLVAEKAARLRARRGGRP